ncbi:MAG: ABC transporter substrate-binding protein, partial [Spirochaetaceae bacterium]|nr:ABC transporter substrate-binding protein [Spirochaetaceae bacterium]
YKDTLTVVLAEDPLTLDPQSANKVIIWSVIPYFYDSLLKENQDGTVEPKLAVEWQLLDDVTWRFKLRQGVKFHNGNPFTAEDVLYSFQRAKKNPLSASTFQYFDTDNTKILDDYTIDVKLFRPYAPIFNTLTNARGFIVDKEYVEEVGDAKAAINPIGTGPYKFVSWISGSELRGTRFDDYWDDRAVTQNVVVKFITEASNRAIELETGNADIIYEIDSADADRVEAFPNAHIVSGTSFRYHTLTFSMQDPILKDKRVRYALSLGVDKPALVKAVFGNTAVAASGFMPPTVFAYKDTGVLPYDPAEAKRLLAEAGYPNGVTFKFLHEAREVDFRMAEVIQNMWKQIGVTLEDYAMESKTYAAGGNKFQVGQRAGNADEASNILIIYDSAFADKLQGNDKKLDDMLHNAMTLYDADKRAAAYAEIQDYLYDQRWSVPLAFTDALYGVSDKVQNFQFHPNQRLEVWKMSVLQ